MPSDAPMSNAPFAVPPDSPFFPNVGGEACFKFENGLWSLCAYPHWPPDAQARCAAVAAMEWDHCGTDAIPNSDAWWNHHYRCKHSWLACDTAYRAARERMNSKPAPCEHCNGTKRVMASVDNDHDTEVTCEVCRERKKGETT